MRYMGKSLCIVLGVVSLAASSQALAQSITLYDARGYSGDSRTITGNERHLRGLDFNDQASSVEVDGGVWELCEHASFGGHCEMVNNSISRLASVGLNNQISSVRRMADNILEPITGNDEEGVTLENPWRRRRVNVALPDSDGDDDDDGMYLYPVGENPNGEGDPVDDKLYSEPPAQTVRPDVIRRASPPPRGSGSDDD